MSGFYSNLALVAVLTGGISVSILLSSHDSRVLPDSAQDSGFDSFLITPCGFISFCLSTMTVLDVVMV